MKKRKRIGYFHHLCQCFGLLSRKSQTIFTAILVFQALASTLDLIGLALIMNIVLGLQSGARGVTGSNIGSVPFLGDLFSSVNTETLLIFVVIIFIAKGFLALFFHTLNIRIMAFETGRLVRKLSKEVFENRTNRYSKLTSQDISYAIYNSTEIVFRDTLVPFSIIVSDFILLLLISANLFVSIQILFLPTVFYFLIIFMVLRKFETRITKSAYRTYWQSEIRTRRLIQEVHSSLRELYTSNNLQHFISRIDRSRDDGIRAGSVVAVANLRPKYFYEMALFGGIGIIALVSKVMGDVEFLLIYLTMFLVSSSRMIPSLLRTQYYLGIFQKSTEQSKKIFEILSTTPVKALESFPEPRIPGPIGSAQSFIPEIRVSNVNFSYDKNCDVPIIADLSLAIHPGETVAIVGQSGAGKSTLVDLLLGYLMPDSGSVKISELDPRSCFKVWPGKVAYVPQKVTIYEGSLFENIALGLSADLMSSHREHVWYLLDGVGLGEFVRSLESGLDSQLSEFGSNLSGGQVQRIGIARALFSNPEIMVLDESTSSLDASSEQAIMEFLFTFKGEKTLIIIAHRLTTVKNADRVVYLGNGKVQAEGTFASLKENLPEFHQQVLLQDFN